MNSAWLSHRSEPFWIEIISGAGFFGWGMYASLAGLPLDSIPAYDILTEHVPDWAWCWISIICGALQIGAAIFEVHRMRQIMAFTMLVLWSVLAVSLWKSGITSPAAMVYCALALGNIPTVLLLQSGPRLRPPV